MTPHAAIDAVARSAYGKLVAFLSARTRDVAAAEDAVADAFRAALETWPRDGVPANPEAWLLTAARRRLADAARHDKVRTDAEPHLRRSAAAARALADAAAGEVDVIPDDRLKLLFACAHPAIDPAARTPLLLQAVLGLDAGRIASAFLASPAAMGQRLVRAKAKIRDAGIAFEVPDRDRLPDRLAVVMDAVYAAFGTGWEDADGTDPRRRDLSAEAIDLARLLADLLPDEPEPKGLLALVLHCEARRPARRSAAGAYVPLDEQDPRQWDGGMIAEAERALRAAARVGRVGRYQLEAAVQSAHADRAVTGVTPWDVIAAMYDALLALHPTPGVAVARAAAVGRARGPAAGLEALTAADEPAVVAYQPYWAVRAHLLAELGAADAARAAYDRAIGLCEDPAARAFLAGRAAAVADDRHA